jgi:hypothetical protein
MPWIFSAPLVYVTRLEAPVHRAETFHNMSLASFNFSGVLPPNS